MSPLPATLAKGEQPRVYKDSNGNRLVVDNGGSILLNAGSKLSTLLGIGALINAATAVVDEQFGHTHRTTITLTNFVVNTTDVGSAEGYASALLYTFPRGLIQLLAATCNLAIVAGAGITATAAVVAGIGSVAQPAAATVTGTSADMIPSTAATLAANAGTVRGQGTTTNHWDNTTHTNATQLPAYLNFGVPDAGSTANTTITVTGTVTFTWINAGDM